ncbi:hypothetical protein B7463_g1319, partial [Scytalidium lignicola]
MSTKMPTLGFSSLPAEIKHTVYQFAQPELFVIGFEGSGTYFHLVDYTGDYKHFMNTSQVPDKKYLHAWIDWNRTICLVNIQRWFDLSVQSLCHLKHIALVENSLGANPAHFLEDYPSLPSLTTFAVVHVPAMQKLQRGKDEDLLQPLFQFHRKFNSCSPVVDLPQNAFNKMLLSSYVGEHVWGCPAKFFFATKKEWHKDARAYSNEFGVHGEEMLVDGSWLALMHLIMKQYQLGHN